MTSTIRNVTNDQVLAIRAQEADTFLSRLRGLLGRTGWGDDADGLWIAPCSGVHTLGMRFPIDVILLDGGLKVLATQTLVPWRIGKLHPDTEVVVEVPTGTVKRSGTEAGHVLGLTR